MTEFERSATVTQTTTVTHPYIRYDPEYIKTIPAIIKVVCIVLDLIGFICIEVSYFSHHSRGSFFNTVAMMGFWFTGIMLVFYLFHVCEKFHKIPWLKIEMYFCAAWALLYMLASSLAAATNVEAFQAAAVRIEGHASTVIFRKGLSRKRKQLLLRLISRQINSYPTELTISSII